MLVAYSKQCIDNTGSRWSLLTPSVIFEMPRSLHFVITDPQIMLPCVSRPPNPGCVSSTDRLDFHHRERHWYKTKVPLVWHPKIGIAWWLSHWVPKPPVQSTVYVTLAEAGLHLRQWLSPRIPFSASVIVILTGWLWPAALLSGIFLPPSEKCLYRVCDVEVGGGCSMYVQRGQTSETCLLLQCLISPFYVRLL